MFKYFRKIRLKLLEEKRIGNYLRYAIGEIFLVVIGISIAVFINTSINHRNDVRKEINYLRAIQNDIHKIETELDTARVRMMTVESACDELLVSIHQPNTRADDDRLNYLTFEMVAVPGNTIAFPTYKSLISTNDLGLIQNDELKRSLNDIDFALLNLETSFQWQDKQWTDINQLYMNRRLDMLKITNSGSDEFRIDLESKYDGNWDEILNDKEFSNIIVNRKWAIMDIKTAHLILRNALNKARELIDAELQRK